MSLLAGAPARTGQQQDGLAGPPCAGESGRRGVGRALVALRKL